MTNAFLSMEYPHWLIIAGVVLLVLGFIGLAFIGLAFRQRTGTETANGNVQGRSELEAEPVQTQPADHKARLAELRKERWANRDRGTEEEPSIYEPEVSDKDPK